MIIVVAVLLIVVFVVASASLQTLGGPPAGRRAMRKGRWMVRELTPWDRATIVFVVLGLVIMLVVLPVLQRLGG